MVNDTKIGVLSILRDSKNPVSGELMGKNLSVSRVAIWKQVKALRDLGYPIHSHPEGYVLASEGDFVYPWELPAYARRIRYFPIISSTMDEAERLREEPGADGVIVVAERQTAGRGRLDRAWISEPGGLYFSLYLRRRTPAAILRRYSLAAAAVVAATVNEMFSIGATVKWPNDVLAGGGKLAGVLVDFKSSGEVSESVSIGIGINVNNRPAGKAAVTTRGIRGERVSRKALLERLIPELDRTFRDPLLKDAADRWKSLSATLGRPVTLRTPGGGSFSGTALDIDENGGLVVRSAKNEARSFLYADCIHKIGSLKPRRIS